MPAYGEFNQALTVAIKRVAAGQGSANVKFSPHSEHQMEARNFDHDDVMTCLRKGKAYGPEMRNGDLRANVVHRGLHIRVAVGGLLGISPDWSRLQVVVVATVMEAE